MGQGDLCRPSLSWTFVDAGSTFAEAAAGARASCLKEQGWNLSFRLGNRQRTTGGREPSRSGRECSRLHAWSGRALDRNRRRRRRFRVRHPGQILSLHRIIWVCGFRSAAHPEAPPNTEHPTPHAP